jgi:hypothetical protein
MRDDVKKKKNDIFDNMVRTFVSATMYPAQQKNNQKWR